MSECLTAFANRRPETLNFVRKEKYMSADFFS